MGKNRRWIWIGLGGLVVVAGGLLASPPGQAFVDIWRTGAIQDAMRGVEKRPYDANAEENLKALHTALLLYHDSEGQFPVANGWMDAIENRLEVNDLTEEDALKKLVRPDLRGTPGAFGYAMNAAAGGKYRDDLAGPKTPLVYESRATGRNAFGDPAKDGSGMAVTLDGSIVPAGPTGR